MVVACLACDPGLRHALAIHLEVIDEFPFFSFLLGDLHPHVLAIPFGLLAIAVALNLFLGGWRGQINLPLGARLHINYIRLFILCAWSSADWPSSTPGTFSSPPR